MEEDMTDGVVDPQGVVDEALKVPEPVVPTPPIPPEPAVSTPPTPPVAPAVEPPVSAPMNPDMPLAFVPPAPGFTPVAPAPAPTIPVEPPKKKSKLGVVLAGIVGLFVVLGGSVAGYLYYTENLPPSKSTIASIQTKYPDPASCNGTCDNGRQLRWDYRNERCEDSGKSCTGTGQGSVVVDLNYTQCNTAGLAWCDGCGGFCIRPIDKTCNQMMLDRCGQTPVYGASCMSVQPDATQSKQYFKSCNCNGKPYWFDAEGTCGDVNDGFSLCAVTKYATCVNDAGGGGGTGGSTCDYTCTNSGCQCKSGDCQIYHWKCDRITNLGGGCQDGTPKIGQSANFSASCGSEQIDVTCNGKSVDFRSRTNTTVCGAPSKPPTIIPSPSPSPSPSGSVAPTMACTGITKNIAAPKIGDNVIFTCAGTTTPATLGSSPSYSFRYNINSGSWQALSNKTTTTAELAVDACGTYGVQCRACLTVGSTTTCDPIWQGASQ